MCRTSEVASSYGEYAKRAGRDDNFRRNESKRGKKKEEEDSALLRVYSIHSLVNMNDFNIP